MFVQTAFIPYYLSTDIDFVCVLCTSSSTAAVASLSLYLSLSLFKGTSHNNIAISLPTLLFFRSYNELFIQTAFIPYYLSTDIDFVCVLCTSCSTAAVASPSLYLSLSLLKGTSHNNIAISLPTLLFFRSYNELFIQTAFIPYFPSGTYYFSICDHGPDSLHAVICDKLTFFPLTGGCSEGLGAFRFFFK